MAILLQRIFHQKLVTNFYQIIYHLAINRSMIFYFTKHRSYFLSFSLIILSIIFYLITIPTLILRHIYAPDWSLVELAYFLITTNHLIGFGDYMPCRNLHGTSRSRCATIMSGKVQYFSNC